jgi:hypothetical protein
MLELTLVVATIMRRWRLCAAPGQVVRLVGGPALMPGADRNVCLPLRLELADDVAATFAARQSS